MLKSNITCTLFGQTKTVRAELHNMNVGDIPDEILYVERVEDYYSLQSPQLKNKKVAIVSRHDWVNSVLDEMANNTAYVKTPVQQTTIPIEQVGSIPPIDNSKELIVAIKQVWNSVLKNT